MARCKRCGATFDYNKKDGVCPKCCFYNRPPGMASHDEEWITTYNVEDNTYELPKSIVEADEEQPRRIFHRRPREERRKYSSDRECRTEGSHVHTERKTWPSGREKNRESTKKTGLSGRKGKWIKLLPAVVIIIAFLFKFLSAGFIDEIVQSFKKTDILENKTYQIEEYSMEDLQAGLTIGDMTFSTDDQGAVVLFQEGELPEIPAGEKCIGIHLSDDESKLNYSGIDWKRPYLYDGKYFRKLVHKFALSDSYRLQQRLGLDLMSEFVSSYQDFDGLALYFVDKDADTVSLCIPVQTLEGEEVSCDGVAEISIPVTQSESQLTVSDRQEEGDNL